MSDVEQMLAIEAAIAQAVKAERERFRKVVMAIRDMEADDV